MKHSDSCDMFKAILIMYFFYFRFHTLHDSVLFAFRLFTAVVVFSF